MPPRDPPVSHARTILTDADRRGLRKRAGIKAATIAEALGVTVDQLYHWERRDYFPRSLPLLTGYARVIAGLARHEAVTWDEDEDAADAA